MRVDLNCMVLAIRGQKKSAGLEARRILTDKIFSLLFYRADFYIAEIRCGSSVLALQPDFALCGHIAFLLFCKPRQDYGSVRAYFVVRPFGHVHVRYMLAVEPCVNVLAFASYAHFMPLAERELCVEFRRHVSKNRTASPSGLGKAFAGTVGNLDFNGVGNPIFCVRAIYYDAAVALWLDSELEFDFKILVVVFREYNFVFCCLEYSVLGNAPYSGGISGVGKILAKEVGPAFIVRLPAIASGEDCCGGKCK